MPSMPSLPSGLPSIPSALGAAQRAGEALGVPLPAGVSDAATGVSEALAQLSGAAPGGAPDIDEIYEGVVERLRRDLLVERERMGDLLGNIGH
jgi:hypothetical protein